MSVLKRISTDKTLLFGDMKKGNELQLPTDPERQKIMIQRNVGLIPY